jgi:predicted PurR-regulated permease PerM
LATGRALPGPTARDAASGLARRDIMDRRLFVTLAAFTGLLLILYLLFRILDPFLLALGWAAVIAIATFPLYRRLESRLGPGGVTAPGLMTLAVFLVVVVPTVVLVALLVQELLQVQGMIEVKAGGQAFADRVLHDPRVGAWMQKAEALAAQANIDLRSAAVNAAKDTVTFLLGAVTTVVKNVFFFLFQILLVLLALFFLYRDGRELDRAFWSLLTLPAARREELRDTVENMVAAVLLGVLVTASIQALLLGLGFWLAGLSSPVLFGALAVVAAMVPVVGVLLVWGPAAIYLAITADVTTTVLFVLWNALVVGGIDNVLRPMLVSGRTGLPLPLMLLGALGGLTAFGFLGLVLGPLVIALFIGVFQLQRRIATDAPAG